MNGCPREYLYAIAAIVGNFAKSLLTATHLPSVDENREFFQNKTMIIHLLFQPLLPLDESLF